MCAVTEAVEECINEDVLAEFFVQYRNEVIEMGMTDLERLNEWFRYAFQAETYEEFRKMIE